MKTEAVCELEPKAAARIAGEDIACGDYVARLREVVEYPSFLWDACGASLSPHELVPLCFIPENAGDPLRVMGVCLPFVYVRTPDGKMATIDTRRTQLVKLHRKVAKVIWRGLRSASRKADEPTGV